MGMVYQEGERETQANQSFVLYLKNTNVAIYSENKRGTAYTHTKWKGSRVLLDRLGRERESN